MVVDENYYPDVAVILKNNINKAAGTSRENGEKAEVFQNVCPNVVGNVE